MKKLFLILAASAVLFACGGGNQKAKSSVAEENEAPIVEENKVPTIEEKAVEYTKQILELEASGDYTQLMELAEEIASFKPLVGVAGNCDNHQLRFIHPLHRFFECEGVKVLMTHVGGYPGRYDVRARELIDRYRPDIFVCGHSHILKVVRDTKRDMLVINPGAAGIQGFHIVRTALRFHIDDGNIHGMEVFELDR